MVGVLQHKQPISVSTGSGSETGAAKCVIKTKQRKNQRLQWRPVSNDNGKTATKNWVMRTFYSNNYPKFAASDSQNTSSDSPSVAGHSDLRDFPDLANDSKASEDFVVLRTFQKNQSNGYKIPVSKYQCSRKGSTRANRQNTSVDSPSTFREAYVEKKQRNGYWRTAKNMNTSLAVPPGRTSVYRGEPAVYFHESVITANAEKFKYCLVGMFPYLRPSLAQIRNWIAKRCKLKGNWSVTLMDHQHVFIRLDNEIDMIQIWIRNKWWIKGHLMKAFKWTPEFQPAKEEPSSAVVWIALPCLPLVFFQEDALFSMASLVGKPIAIDVPTRMLSRITVARVCIEVDLLKALPHRLWIGIGEGGFWQEIRYKKLPSYCQICLRQGHSTIACKFKTSDAAVGSSNVKATKLNGEINHPFKKDGCEMLNPSTGCKVDSETSVQGDSQHDPNNPGTQCTDIENIQMTQIEKSGKSQPSENVPCCHVVRKPIRGSSVGIEFSSKWNVDPYTQEEYRTPESAVPEPLEGESSQTKQTKTCSEGEDEQENNQLIKVDSSQLPSNEAMDKIVTRDEKVKLTSATNHSSNRGNYEMLEVNKEKKSVLQNMVKGEPCCNPHNGEIQHTGAKNLENTPMEGHISDEYTAEVDSPVMSAASYVLSYQQSNQEIISANSVDAEYLSDSKRNCETFIQHSGGVESSQAKNAQNHPALQGKDSSSQPICKNFAQLPLDMIDLVEAQSISSGNSQNAKIGTNKSKQGFGAILSTLFIGKSSGNRVSVRPGKNKGKQSFSTSSTSKTSENRENYEVRKKKRKLVFGATFSGLFIGKSSAKKENVKLGNNEDKENVSGTKANLPKEVKHKQRVTEGASVLDEKEANSTLYKQKEQQLKNEGHSKMQGSQTSMKFSSKKQKMFRCARKQNLGVKKETNYCQIQVFHLEHCEIQRYQYSDLYTMTRSFSDKIGEGAFGSVFKGVLPDGLLSAVKVLTREFSKGEAQFNHEISTLRRTDHVNIIRLLGFCSEGSERALAYEYMPNRSLDKFIFGTQSTGIHLLGWEKLYRIAVGIARGLKYLHSDCSVRILHLDIKPQNILLDEDFWPKISDFGLAELWTTDETVLEDGVRGTVGYLAPEYVMHRRPSDKADVYGYGVTLLEMVGGRKATDAMKKKQFLPSWIYERLAQGDIGHGGFAEKATARKIALVGMWCTQQNPEDRPSMTRVLEWLEGNINLEMPPKPSFTDDPIPLGHRTGRTYYSANFRGLTDSGAAYSLTNSLQGR